MDSSQFRTLDIDLDDLLLALSGHDDLMQSRYLLDLETGAVLFLSDAVDLDDLPSGFDEEDPRWIGVEPLDSSERWRWMEDFIALHTSGRLAEQLSRAIHGRKPFRHFRDVLAGHPAEREAWFAFQREGLRQAAERWCQGWQIQPRWVRLTPD